MRSISTRWLFLIVVVPVLLAIAVLAYLSYRKNSENIQEDIQQTAKAMSQAVDSEIIGALKFTQAFAASTDELGSKNYAAIRRKAISSLTISNIADAMALTEESGQLVVNTFAPDNEPLPKTNNISRVRQIFGTGKPLVSNLIIGTVSKRPLIAVDVPVIRNGKVIYDLNAVLLSSRLNRILGRQKLPAGWYAVIFDSQGTIAARSHDPEKYIGQKVIPTLLERLSGPLEGMYESQTLEGVPITAAYARSEASGYSVAIGVPKTLIIEKTRAAMSGPLLGVAAATLLSLFLVWRFGGVIQRQRETVAVIQEEQQRLYGILETLPVYVVLLTPDYHVAFANRVFRERFGEHEGRRCYEFLFNRTEPCEICETYSVLRNCPSREWEWTGPDGRVYSIYDQRFTDANGNMQILEMGIDVTKQKQAEQKQNQLNRALRLVSQCNSMLIHTKDETALLNSICGLMITTGGYLMAWIGVAEHDASQTVRPIAQSGDENGYLESIRVSWGDNEYGHGPTGTAIRTRTTQVNQNCRTNLQMAPWREAALKQGYQSSIALPLISGETASGVLTVYSGAPDTFSEEEVALMEQLADDLAFGLAAIRTEGARQQAVAGQEGAEERYRTVLDNAADAVVIIDPEARFFYANQQAEQLLGYSFDELRLMVLWDIVPPQEVDATQEAVEQVSTQGRARKEITLLDKDGLAVPIEINAVRLPDGNFYVACRDITDRKSYEAQLEYRATHDALTGLANRNLLTDRIDQSIAHARRTDRSVAVMLLDMDRFKLINDSLGHEVGDAMLEKVANVLSSSVRADDTVARLGGDEFVVVIADWAAGDDVAALGRKLLSKLAEPIQVAGHDLMSTASLGIAVFPQDGKTTSELIRNADAAMYRAKELGRNSLQFYAPEMNARMLERLEIETGLRRALAQHELELHYQPKVNLRHGYIVGAEALLRWRHPVAGMVSPGDFIPLAEETGLIVPIGEWVIETACKQLKAWRNEGLEEISVAINISARQFQQANLTEIVAQALRINGVEAKHLDLEVTETAVMGAPEKTAAILHALKAIGVKISLDDFGTGYSSLNYLKRFPIDCLKIDQSFVRDMTTDPDDAAIAKLVLSLGHDLNYRVIAEGVETEAQLQFLRRYRCEEMQGYLFSRALPAGEFAALIRQGHRLNVIDENTEGLRTLLIVDDEPNILSALKRLLRPDGYHILTAASALEALAILARHSVQVIIADQRMSEMSGTEFLKRAWHMYPDTVRILLTGYTEIESVIQAVNQGAILKFLTKPWDDDLLRNHIREAFRYQEAK